jgi:Type VI secretion system/phage-baseplate injector OB domain
MLRTRSNYSIPNLPLLQCLIDDCGCQARLASYTGLTLGEYVSCLRRNRLLWRNVRGKSWSETVTQFFGKYRGTVVLNSDPLLRGRVIVTVPEVYGDLQSTWAEPCLSVSECVLRNVAVPPIGTLVWVEFERGAPELPIWAGCISEG